jgi:hypothetical protein
MNEAAARAPALLNGLLTRNRSAAEDGGDECSPAPCKSRSKEFYERFLATISERFQENARETRTTLRDLAGGPIKIMPSKDGREFMVCCALSRAAFPLFSD